MFELQLERAESLRQKQWSVGLTPHEAEELETLEARDALPCVRAHKCNCWQRIMFSKMLDLQATEVLDDVDIGLLERLEQGRDNQLQRAAEWKALLDVDDSYDGKELVHLHWRLDRKKEGLPRNPRHSMRFGIATRLNEGPITH